jgi:deoxyribodipyrimidine photolyase
MDKPREFWVNQWECMANADLAWRSPDNAKLDFNNHQVYVNKNMRQQIETIHVIEQSAYAKLKEEVKDLNFEITHQRICREDAAYEINELNKEIANLKEEVKELRGRLVTYEQKALENLNSPNKSYTEFTKYLEKYNPDAEISFYYKKYHWMLQQNTDLKAVNDGLLTKLDKTLRDNDILIEALNKIERHESE